MEFKVVHIISNLDRINFGVWNAALFGSGHLKNKHGVLSHVWVCTEPGNMQDLQVPVTYLGNKRNFSEAYLRELLNKNQLSAASTIFISHGCWLAPTVVGYKLRKLGLPWIYTPHGMLEKWSFRQGMLKKLIYYFLFEKKWMRKATAIRAVSFVEKENLQALLEINKEIRVVENGVVISEHKSKSSHVQIFLFMARLHHKKGILPLVQAWTKVMANQTSKKLYIAGPDEGELRKIEQYISGNIQYLGPVYGEEKQRVLESAHYYLLPSFSEGFPTSVLEAMSFGLIPLISSGCNFPDVFVQKLGYRLEPDEQSLSGTLKFMLAKDFDYELSLKNREFVLNRFSEAEIGEKLFHFYLDLLTNPVK